MRCDSEVTGVIRRPPNPKRGANDAKASRREYGDRGRCPMGYMPNF